MVGVLLLLALPFQQIRVESSVDREELMLGENVVLTITVEASGNEAVQIINPALAGLELLGTTDRSDVSIREGVATRVLTRELRLRAVRPGTARIGEVQVRMGTLVTGASPVEVHVAAATGATIEALEPHVRAMIERHVTPRLTEGEVYVEVLTSTDSVMLGEQIDLVVVAWFPEQIRSRLRNPPMLSPPQLAGAWTYAQGVPGAVDLRRRVSGTWYHLYVHSQSVFPLTPGVLEVGPATVTYSMPLSYSFLSREVRHEPQSDSVRLFVAAQPEPGRPNWFDGAAATGLEFNIAATRTELSVGDATMITATLSGSGNVALWPEPQILWPEGVRAYPEGVEVDLQPDAGRIAGSKRFHYLVVADSSGVHQIGEVTYPYFDTDASDYAVLQTPSLDIVAGTVSDALETGAATPRALMFGRNHAALARLQALIPRWGWLAVFLAPPLLVVISLLLSRIPRSNRPSASKPVATLDRLEREFRSVLRGLVLDAEQGNTNGLAEALRAVGVEGPVALHAARVRDRLWQANYGPAGEVDPEELSAEVHEILRTLTGESSSRSGTMSAGVAVCLIFLAVPLACSAQSAERLFEAGALRAAADSFEQRTVDDPFSVADWYNLGITLRSLGAIPEARRAWILAARIAPRNGQIRRALGELPAQDPVTGGLMWVSPLSVAEVLLAAGIFWVVGWVLVGFRVCRRIAVAGIVVAVVGGGYGMYVQHKYAAPVAIVRSAATSLRVAPYGTASSRRSLDAGTGLIVTRLEGAWAFVERGSDLGWVLHDEVVSIR